MSMHILSITHTHTPYAISLHHFPAVALLRIFTSFMYTSQIKLIDFGLSKNSFEQGSGGGRVKKMKTTVGTSYYIAPEVLAKSYTNAADMWSMGVIVYILLCGYPPFNGSGDNGNKEIFAKIRKGKFAFTQPVWAYVIYTHTHTHTHSPIRLFALPRLIHPPVACIHCNALH